MKSSLSTQRLQQFVAISTQYYSWELIMAENGITDAVDKGEQWEITCPFHEDNRPSMRLTKRSGLYHCFSCNRAGSYTKFLWELGGKRLSYPQFCEQILKANPGMQAELRFNSLFIEGQTLDPAFNKRRVFVPNTGLGTELPITSLATKVRKMGDTWENLVVSLTFLQQDVPTDNILATISKRTAQTAKPERRLSLMELLDD